VRTAPVFDLPVGMNVNLDPTPACRWSAVLDRGVNGCGRRSRVGSGTAVLDGRPAGRGYPLQAKVRVYSALLDQPPPPRGMRALRVLLVYAHAPGAELFMPYFPNRVLNPSGLLPQNSLTSVPFGIGLLDLKLRLHSMRWPQRKGGKPLFAAPTRCRGAWRFSVSVARLVATDDVPCRKGASPMLVPSPILQRVVPLVAIGAVAAVPMLVTASRAGAGPPASNGTDTLQLETAAHPATTASRAHPRPVALDLALRHTAVSGAPATPPRLFGFDLPRGMNVTLEPRPKCRWTRLLQRGLTGCSKRSQVGAGTAVLDGRPAGRGYPLPAKVRVFSALMDEHPPGFRAFPVLAVYAVAPGAEVFIRMGVGSRDASDVGASATTVPYGVGIEQLDLTFRRMRWPQAEGGKPFIQAPTRCAGSWRFTADMTFVRFGPHLVATDDVPCERGG
jgi:hypothetical protein